MKRLLLALIILTAVPVFADHGSFVYYDYGYDAGYYDDYWYNDYWYDGYWVFMPYGYYCVRFVWWYPWWWDWYWSRCYWCHHFHWDFFYSGFYVVWYDQGTWWYRPRYGQYVRYRLPHSYVVLRTKARTHGIYLPEKPPREIDLPYNESRVMSLARQNDPELFARVEREQRSGNLEQMRSKYVKQVNNEIATKNREHGIESKAIDINRLANREKPIPMKSTENPLRAPKNERISQPSNKQSERSRIETPSRPSQQGSEKSRIQKEDKGSPTSRSGPADRSAERAETGRTGQSRVQQPKAQKEREDADAEKPQAGKAKVEDTRQQGSKSSEKNSAPPSQKRPDKRSTDSRERPVYGPHPRSSEDER